MTEKINYNFEVLDDEELIDAFGELVYDKDSSYRDVVTCKKVLTKRLEDLRARIDVYVEAARSNYERA